MYQTIRALSVCYNLNVDCGPALIYDSDNSATQGKCVIYLFVCAIPFVSSPVRFVQPCDTIRGYSL